jgi:peptide/nickel transport system ATP-binding protein
MSAALLVATDLRKSFAGRGRHVAAVNSVSFALARGETLGIVGPSGSGKSTLARMLLRLVEPDAGRIEFAGEDLLALRHERLRAIRKRIQMVFQDPLAAFNPRATVAGALSDPLRIHRIVPRRERPAAVVRLLERVGLSPNLAARAIHEISGGQRQRLAIARALATGPELIVLDEAVSALDISVRGQILELLVDVQKTEGVAYVFVSHDLAVVRAIAHGIAIMDAGRIVERGPTPAVVADPQSATGRALVAAVPQLRFR